MKGLPQEHWRSATETLLYQERWSHLKSGSLVEEPPFWLRFILAFLDSFDARVWKGFKRDWFNQRAFNKHLSSAMGVRGSAPVADGMLSRLVLEWVDAGAVKVQAVHHGTSENPSC